MANASRVSTEICYAGLAWQVPNAETLLGIYGNEWSRTLPAREQDVLYLHLWMCFGGMHARTQPFNLKSNISDP